MQRRDWLLAALAMLGGCGGVDSGGTGTGTAPPTLAVGTITGFGSIIVNGVRYDDSAAAIEDDDGRALTPAQLKLGMQATVQASAIVVNAGVSSATASTIAVRSDILGPVEAIDRALGRLTVLGQSVAVVASTVFDDALAMGLAAVNVGDLLEVHGGFDAAAGRTVATRIERRASATAYKLRGVIGGVSLVDRTLTIGNALVDWSGAAPANPSTTLVPGALIRVVLSPTRSGTAWRATSLAIVTPMLADRDRVEVEGRITAFTSAQRFEVAGLPVDASAASFPDGTVAIVLGAKVEVKGSARGGVIVAQVVEVERDDDASGFELHGTIAAVDPVAQRLVVRGITVAWSAATQFDGGSAADLLVGREVEIRGSLSADGTRLDATLIHVER
jgi:hypothetical protein